MTAPAAPNPTYRHLDQAVDLAIRGSVVAAKHQAQVATLKAMGLITAELVAGPFHGDPPHYRIALTERGRQASANRARR